MWFVGALVPGAIMLSIIFVSLPAIGVDPSAGINPRRIYWGQQYLYLLFYCLCFPSYTAARCFLLGWRSNGFRGQR